MKKLSISKIKGLSSEETSRILGGTVNCDAGTDGRDCNSELASGGGTTDSAIFERGDTGTRA